MSFANLWRRLRFLALAGVAACAVDPTTSPATKSPSAPDASLLSSLTLLKPLQRKDALTEDISVAQTIGVRGGKIAIPAAGFTLVVPPGAVDRDTPFVVTALRGSTYAYEFSPHGTRFLRPLSAEQDINGAKNALALAPLLKVGYFPEKSLIGANGLSVLVSEILPGLLDLRLKTFDWKIEHFSGYIVAW